MLRQAQYDSANNLRCINTIGIKTAMMSLRSMYILSLIF